MPSRSQVQSSGGGVTSIATVRTGLPSTSFRVVESIRLLTRLFLVDTAIIERDPIRDISELCPKNGAVLGTHPDPTTIFGEHHVDGFSTDDFQGFAIEVKDHRMR